MAVKVVSCTLTAVRATACIPVVAGLVVILGTNCWCSSITKCHLTKTVSCCLAH
jgi:hypothetical protein